ncbi:MAG: ABC transporter permease [Armatimonadota bacterium]|nr:ABC transporter permease [Armatimonadota bacterium]
MSQPVAVQVPDAVDQPAAAPPRVVAPVRARRAWVNVALSAVSPVAFLTLWEAASRLGWLNALFFPAPTVILATMGQMLASGELWRHLEVSLRRVGYGFLVGATPAVVLGLAMGWSGKVRVIVEPLISATLPIPKLVILPIIMLIFGIGEASKIVIVAVGAFYPALINSAAGVTGIRPVYFEVARNFGATRWQKFRRLIVPGSLPMVFVGLRLAFGMALLMVVASEFVSARTGVGAMIWLAWETLRTDKLYAGIAAWATVGIVSSAVLMWAQRLIIRWR